MLIPAVSLPKSPGRLMPEKPTRNDGPSEPTSDLLLAQCILRSGRGTC